jgi:hypothetical protein
MFEIERGGQRFQSFIRKLFREETTERIAKCFARKVALGALEFEANKFETIGLGAAETLDGKREALIGMVGDGSTRRVRL